MNTQDLTKERVVLDHFVIERKLGVGAFATAYLAHQLPMERPAVVKITHPHLLTPETAPMIRQRFAAEIRASTRVNHPNLVTLYTTGEVQGVPAFAMEYIEGVSLEQWLEDRAPFDDETMRVLVVQLLSALKALHRAEIIHRDLSPRNIMVSPLSATGELKLTLLDFGVAQLDGHIHHGPAWHAALHGARADPGRGDQRLGHVQLRGDLVVDAHRAPLPAHAPQLWRHLQVPAHPRLMS